MVPGSVETAIRDRASKLFAAANTLTAYVCFLSGASARKRQTLPRTTHNMSQQPDTFFVPGNPIFGTPYSVPAASPCNRLSVRADTLVSCSGAEGTVTALSPLNLAAGFTSLPPPQASLASQNGELITLIPPGARPLALQVRPPFDEGNYELVETENTHSVRVLTAGTYLVFYSVQARTQNGSLGTFELEVAPVVNYQPGDILPLGGLTLRIAAHNQVYAQGSSVRSLSLLANETITLLCNTVSTTEELAVDGVYQTLLVIKLF